MFQAFAIWAKNQENGVEQGLFLAYIGQLSPPSRIMQVLHCVGLIVVVPCNIVLGSGGCRQLGLVRAG